MINKNINEKSGELIKSNDYFKKNDDKAVGEEKIYREINKNIVNLHFDHSKLQKRIQSI